ncbi:MAG: UDP-N-acetylglucosamine--N-acetylmuramyl-(pentapeptide) pyrophosphoryl-undecaprenol N-acetylglucosamine transferase [bacterium]
MITKNKSIVLIGGGTGGHAAPILAIYQKLKEISPDLNVSVFGVGSLEERYFLKDIPEYRTIFAGKLNRYLTLKNLIEAVKVFVGFFQSLYYLGIIRPTIIFSKGGFTSLPMIYAARLLGIPYFFHESDIEMGKVNLLMADKAEKIFVCFPIKKYPRLDLKKVYWSGPVLRKGFLDDKEAQKEIFGFDNDKSIILVTGGSQGSLHLSKNMLGAAKNLLKKYNIIHQTGKFSYEYSRDFYTSLEPEFKNSYYYKEFLTNSNGQDLMLEAIDVADVVISRSGSTIVELAVKGKNMILVPWKHAAQDHQSKNADYFLQNDSAIVITDDELSPHMIEASIDRIMLGENPQDLGKNAQKLFPTNGLEMICEKIISKIKE